MNLWFRTKLSTKKSFRVVFFYKQKMIRPRAVIFSAFKYSSFQFFTKR